MSEQELSPWGEEKLYSEKKLRKHEQKLRERLQEAQEDQSEALERLLRAEERMRKRMAQVQHLEERLNIVHQQMEALQAPHGTVVTMIVAGAEAFAPMLEAPSSSRESVLSLTDEVPTEAALENSVGVAPAGSIEKIVEEGDVERAHMVDEGAEPHYRERFSDTHVIEVSSGEERVSEEEMPVAVDELLVVDDAAAEALFTGDEDQETSEVLVDDVVKQAMKARAVAEAAEEAARVAIERADDIEEYLEQFGAARHLMQELERLQVAADHATVIAREAEEAAQVAERLLSPIQEEGENVVMFLVEDEEREEPIREMDKDDAAQFSEAAGHPSPLEVAQVEEIEEEEEDLETVAAMIIADAAGTAAAQAEAEAEASSARTREARTLALKADQALEGVRAAIRKQKLSGEGAEIVLRAAEREATHAHAVLADAEAAEERALNAAMNAEAEAEVAEGMAFAVSSRDERDEKLRDENGSV